MPEGVKRSLTLKGKRINLQRTLWVTFLGLALTIVLGSPSPIQSSAPQPQKQTNKEAILAKALKLQMPFIANDGQIKDERVRFYAQTFAGTAYVSKEGIIVYSLPYSQDPKSQTWTLREKLVGISNVSLRGVEQTPTKVNYFIGNDETKWKTDIPTYKAVSLGEIYQGIHLSLKASGKKVEKVFALQPKADVNAIRLELEGASSLKVSDKGELVVETAPVVVHFGRPLAYQKKNGKRQYVKVAYRVDKNSYGFSVGQYDASLPLVIDPALEYSTFLGGSGTDSGNGIAVDASGNAYVVGSTDSINFDLKDSTPSPSEVGPTGGTDVFVAKLNGDGTDLVYLTYLGGKLDDTGHGIAVDASGSAYLTGQTFSKDFPIPRTPKQFDSKIGGNNDAFVTKLSPDGSALIYSTFLGGGGKDAGHAIAVDTDGYAHVVGETLSSNFPITPHAVFAASQGNLDGFVVKLDPDGNLPADNPNVYSTYLGGNGEDICFGVAVTDGSTYVTGKTASADFPVFPAAGAFDPFLNGPTDAFAAKLETDGSALVYSTHLGGPGEETGFGITVDDSGNAYVTGSTDLREFDSNASTPVIDNFGSLGNTDAFIARLNTAGSGLEYLAYLGGGSEDASHGIAIDEDGNIYVAGSTSSSSGFPISPYDNSLGGLSDAFLTKLTPAATGYDVGFFTYLGGTSDEAGLGLSLDGAGNAYVTGQTSSTDFPTAPASGVFDEDLNGPADAFVAKMVFNTPPEAIDDAYTVSEDGTLSIQAPGVLENDTDADNDTLTCLLVDDVANGTLLLYDDGSFAYTPYSDFSGTDSFTYVANDGSQDSDAATVTITVEPVNDPPVAVDDSVTTPEDTPITIAVLGNDTDVDGDILSVDSVTQGSNGSVTINEDNTVTYSPAVNFNGDDAFTYTVSDGNGGSDSAEVTITINSVNDPPVAVADTATTPEDTPITIAVLSNDSDADSAEIWVNQITPGSHGSVTILTGGVRYTPDSNFYGTDSFTYTVIDSEGATDTATVTVEITPVNDAPEASNDAYSVDEDNTLTVDAASGVLHNDSDADGDTLSAYLADGPNNAANFTLNGDGSFTYTPSANFNGTDSFTYQATDSYSGSLEATVTITINSVNDAPVSSGIDAYFVGIDEDPTEFNLSEDFSDVDAGDTLSIYGASVEGCDATANWEVMILTLDYAPGQQCQGTVSVTVEDGNGGSTSESFDLCVDQVETTSDPDEDGIGNYCDPDDDNDGILDVDDNCPLRTNSGQEDGDGDGVGNECDNCLDVANPNQVDADGDGLGAACDPDDNAPQIGGGFAPPVDTDGDGLNDNKDNCPNSSDPDQTDIDNDGLGYPCDDCPGDALNDADNDGFCAGTGYKGTKTGDNDNCPDVSNPGQEDLDGDGTGNACDSDADGDGYIAAGYDGGDDCGDTNSSVNPGATEVMYNGIDDDCNPATADSDYYVVFAMTDRASWLPEDSRQAEITAEIFKYDSGGPIGPLPADTSNFSLAAVSNHPGKFTNDFDVSIGPDFEITSVVSGYDSYTVTLTCYDYGASATLHFAAVVTYGGSQYPVQGDFVIPLDSDGDGLADAWEMAEYGNLSTLTSANGDPDGDGLTNLEEFRGFWWGPELVRASSIDPTSVGLADDGAMYQTEALIPHGAAVHFRTSTAMKDLFIKVTGYDFNTGNVDTEWDAPCDCPAAFGTAFANSNVALHVVSLDNLPQFMGDASPDIADWETNIDVAQISNIVAYNYGGDDGHTNKIGKREWGWDLKGWSGVGTGTDYGVGTRTYWQPLDYYFTDRPYQEDPDCGNSAGLDPIDTTVCLEDKNDNGINDRVAGQYEAGCKNVGVGDCVFSGDILSNPMSFANQRSAFDIDDDGHTELPIITDPTAASGYTYEATRYQVLKHTMTHELGHAVGMSADHCSDATCSQYEYSNNWERDNHFDSYCEGQIRIHNQ